MRGARRLRVFPPGRDQPPTRIHEFDFAGGAIEAQDRDDRRGRHVVATREGIAVMPAEMPKPLDFGFFRGDVAAAHARIIAGMESIVARGGELQPIRTIRPQM